MNTLKQILGPASEINTKPLSLQEILKKRQWHTRIPLYVPFGRGWLDQVMFMDFRELPYLLIAGTNGSGKTTFIKSLLAGLATKHNSKNLKFLIITSDGKDYMVFSKSKYLLEPVNTNPQDIEQHAVWLHEEMDRRYRQLSDARTPNIIEYNKKNKSKLPFLFLVIDGFSELTSKLTKPEIKRIEKQLVPLLQMARATGIHLIIATQSLSTRLVPEMVNANFTARVAFKTATKKDSKDIIHIPSAEHLAGKGDAIISHHSDGGVGTRIQTPYVTDTTLRKLLH
ncbi:MAG: DNA translocase FtsK [Candidatus Doudnabacteria bacterium]|nr:DNA translocase FtsK [Candidatus Doudnabacteria bacterium]